MTAPVTVGVNDVDPQVLRLRIDQIDKAISDLLKERASVSLQMQSARVRSGGARVDLGREREVITAYQAHLGQRGSDVATTVLNFCRGQVTAADAADHERKGQALHANGVAG